MPTARDRLPCREDSAMLSEIIGPELLIVFGIVVLLFGGSQLPKLARSLGRTKTELSRGLAEGNTNKDEKRNLK
jgi:sec-independent protein translocase protein TatA